MRIALSLILCLSSGWICAEARKMEVLGSKVALPEGNVVGAAFYEEKGLFVVQQIVLSTENSGLTLRSRRQLSSWSLQSRSMTTKRDFDMTPRGRSAYACGRVEASAKS